MHTKVREKKSNAFKIRLKLHSKLTHAFNIPHVIMTEVFLCIPKLEKKSNAYKIRLKLQSKLTHAFNIPHKLSYNSDYPK